MAMALTLFGLTTEPRTLVAELQRRGISTRLTFAAAMLLTAIPALLDRGREIAAAQRSRGLDTEGSVGARVRGVLPIVAPLVLSTIHGVEERTLALEARAFSRPGPRHPLWTPADTPAQRVARLAIAGALVVLLLASWAGLLPALP
jgi:energy-coupling factor transport system permease protein